MAKREIRVVHIPESGELVGEYLSDLSIPATVETVSGYGLIRPKHANAHAVTMFLRNEREVAEFMRALHTAGKGKVPPVVALVSYLDNLAAANSLRREFPTLELVHEKTLRPSAIHYEWLADKVRQILEKR